MPQSHCAKSTAEQGRIDHSCSVRESFLVILAKTMTMTINSNSVLLISVTSVGQHDSFEHVQNFRTPNANTFHSSLCTLKTCSYLLCHTIYVLYSSHSYTMAFVHVIFLAQVSLCRIYCWTWTNVKKVWNSHQFLLGKGRTS